MKERNYEFRKRMENFFLKPGRNPALKPEPGEVGISGEWEISAEGESHPLLDRAVFDLSRFLEHVMRIKSAPGKKTRKIIPVTGDGKTAVLQIGNAADSLGFLLRRVQRRQQHSRQNRDDRNHHQEFYQRKAVLTPE